MQALFLGLEDPLEKELATHSSILAWKIPWTEEPGRLQSMGLQRVGHDRVTKHARMHIHAHTHTDTHPHTQTHTLINYTVDYSTFHFLITLPLREHGSLLTGM